MKLLLSVALLIATNCSSQNCKVIDSLRSFHGVRFGDNIDKGIMKIATGLGDNYFMIDRKESQKNNNTYRLTYFENHVFDNLFLLCNKSKNVYSFMLSTNINGIDSAELKNGTMPSRFSDLIDKLQSIFGAYNTEKISSDSILRLDGIQYKYTWQCKKTKIECSIGFGGWELTNKIHIVLTDLDLQREAQLENIK